MKLPELSPAAAAPRFVDAASCKEWLEHLPLVNTAVAQQELLAEIEAFNRFPTAAANRLAVMEALREAVSFVQVEQARRFSNRPLPLAEAEASAFEDTIDLWDEMHTGYLRCLEAAAAGEAGMRGHAALITQRLAAYIGLKMFHYFRAYREVPAADWRALHSSYAQAERMHVEEDGVKDFLNRDVHDSSPRIAYARAVLMGLANPHELSQRQLTFVAYLLERWASKLEILRRPPPEEPGVPPLIVDLAGEGMPERRDAGAAPAPREPRYLDMRKLAKSLRNRVGLLRKGESPAKLALGEDCVQPSCEQTLVYLFRQWCQARPARAARRPGAGLAQATNDLDTIHYWLTGGAHRRPLQETELTTQQRQELETLGRIRSAHEDTHRPAGLEDWTIENDSAQGMQLVRRGGPGGRRYQHGQLVAVRPGDAPTFLFGQVRWLMGATSGDLHAGIKLMPGLPLAATAHSTGLNEKNARAAAFLLGAVAALQAPPTLVLPAGWFRPNRVIQVEADQSLTVRLLEVLERGIDFERVTYTNA